MNLRDQALLSCYEELAPLSERSALVREMESGQVFVRKKVHKAPAGLLRKLKRQSFHGLPRIELLIQDGEDCILIEEYISGHSLGDYIRQGALTEERLLSWMRTLLEDMSRLHQASPALILGGLEWENIRINDQGRPILMNHEEMRLEPSAPASGQGALPALRAHSLRQETARDVCSYALLFLNLLEQTGVSAQNRRQVLPVLQRCLSRQGAFLYPDAGALLKALGWGEETEIFDETDEKPWLRYLPPGFQTTNLVGLASALSLYQIMLYAANYTATRGGSEGFSPLHFGIALTVLTLCTLFLGNYLDLWKWTPLVQSRNPLIHWAGILFWTLICYWGPIYLVITVTDWLGLL